jgi:hypothetical protein
MIPSPTAQMLGSEFGRENYEKKDTDSTDAVSVQSKRLYNV